MRNLNSKYAVLACLALGGCHLGFGSPKAPAGQVAATVDGKEITQRQLRAELGDLRGANAQAQKEAEVGRLRLIILRTALADEARKQGVDQTPDFVLLKNRAMDELLAQALENKVASDVPAPTRDEAQRYVTDHPELFSERKIFTVDQIRVARAADPQLNDELKPINTMPEAISLLEGKHIPFARSTAALDSLGMNPTAIDGISKLPPQAVFFFPSGGDLLINQIQSTRVEPITGENAVTAATQLLTRQHQQEAVSKSVQQIMTKASKTISYNAAYAPKAAAGNPAKPAGAGK